MASVKRSTAASFHRRWWIGSVLETYLRFGNYLGSVPFNLTESTCLEIKCILPRWKRALFLCLSISTGSSLFLEAILSSTIIEANNTVDKIHEMFRFTSMSVWVIYNLISKFVYLTKFEHFGRMLSLFREAEARLPSKEKSNCHNSLYRWASSHVELLFLGLVVVTATQDSYYIYLEAHKVPLDFRFNEQFAKFEALFGGYVNDSLLQALVGFQMICACYGVLQSAYTDYLLCCVAVCMYKLTVSSIQRLQEPASFKEKIFLFRRLQSITASINETLGTMILFGQMSSVPFYIFNVYEALHGEWVVKVQLFLYFFPVLMTWYFAAEISSMIQAGVFTMEKSCRSENDRQRMNLQDSKRVYALLHAIQDCRVGIKGRIFTITYALSGALATTIAAYAIVILDSHDDRR